MKLGYLIPRLVLVLIVWGLMSFGFDPLLRWSLQWAGSATLKRDVQIASIETQFFPPRFSAQRSKVPSHHSGEETFVSADQVTLALDGGALLRRSAIVEEGSINGLLIVPDADSKNAAGEKGEQADWSETLKPLKQASSQWVEQMLSRAEQQYDLERLETVRLSQQLEADYKAQFDEYKRVAKQLHDRLLELKLVAKDKSGSAFDRLDRYKNIPAEVEHLLAESKRLKQQLKLLPEQANRDYQSLLQAKERDLAMAKSELVSLTPGGEAFTQLILGPDTREYIGQLQHWYQTAMQWKSALFPELEPTRSAGIDIPFLVQDPLPQFWMKKLSVSGLIQHDGQQIPFIGQMTGVTENPQLIDEPIRIHLTGDYNGGYELKGQIDMRPEIPIVEWTAEFEPAEQLSQTLVNDDKLSLGLLSQQRQAVIKCRLVGQQLEATVDLKHSQVKFDVAGAALSTSKLESKLQTDQLSGAFQSQLSQSLNAMQPVSLLEEVLSGVKTIEAQVKLSGELSKPGLKIETDLGDQLASQLRQSWQAKLKHQQLQWEQTVQQELNSRVASFQQKIAPEYQDLMAELNLQDALADQVIKQVAKAPTKKVLDLFLR